MKSKTPIIFILVCGLICGGDLSFASVKFTNQKAGQFCKTSEVGSVVATSTGKKLKCSVASMNSKPRWMAVAITKSVSSPAPKVATQAGLQAVFSNTYTATPAGFQIQITNFDPAYTWVCLGSSGVCSVDPVNGLVTVTDYSMNLVYTLTVDSTRIGYTSERNSFSFSPKLASPLINVAVGSNQSLKGGAQFKLSNYDANWSWTVAASIGSATIDSTGAVLVSGLTSGEGAVVTVTESRPGYLDRSSTVDVSALPEFKVLSARDWQLIAKDPDGNAGAYITVFGHITQFDAATGLNTFRADISGVNLLSNGYWIGGDNTFLTGDPNLLKPFVAGDIFIADVKVIGSYTYTTTTNGKITVPELQVYDISIAH